MKNLYATLTLKERTSLKFISLKRGEVLFQENDLCEYIGIVITGQIQISSYSLKGNEVIYNVLENGDIFGNNLIFSSSPYYRGEVVAKVTTYLALIRKDQLIALLQKNKEFLITYLSISSDFTKSMNAQLKLLSFSSPEDRLYFLFHLGEDVIYYKSISSLAKTLFVSRETLHRLITKLEKENKIIKDSKNKRLLLKK